MLLLDCEMTRAKMVLERVLAQSKEVLAAPLAFKYHISCVPDQVRDYEALLSPQLSEDGMMDGFFTTWRRRSNF